MTSDGLNHDTSHLPLRLPAMYPVGLLLGLIGVFHQCFLLPNSFLLLCLLLLLEVWFASFLLRFVISPIYLKKTMAVLTNFVPGYFRLGWRKSRGYKWLYFDDSEPITRILHVMNLHQPRSGFDSTRCKIGFNYAQ